MRDSQRYTEEAVALSKLAALADTRDERDHYIVLAGACVRAAADAASYERGLEAAGIHLQSA